MIVRLLGASMVIAGCTVCGAIVSANQKKEIETLENLICVLDLLVCDLEYNRTPLPELCRKLGSSRCGTLSAFFIHLADEMDSQIKPSVSACVIAALQNTSGLTREVQNLLCQLGDSLGVFDVAGEIRSVQALRSVALQKLDAMRIVRKEKGKANQTLWVCAGVAAAVLMM